MAINFINEKCCLHDAGGYDSRMRTLIKFVTLLLGLDFEKIEEYERFVVHTFEDEEHEVTESVALRSC